MFPIQITTTNQAIAKALNIATDAIAEVQEWAKVLWVRFVSGRPRFVSKKVIEVKAMNKPVLKQTSKYQINPSVVLDGSQVIPLTLKKQDWYKRLTPEQQTQCHAEFKNSFKFDSVDRCTFLVPNTEEARQLTMKWLVKAGL